MGNVRPDIFRYHDYKTFLTDWLDFRKSGPSKFSLRMLAKLAGFSTGYLPMVLSGKRPLTADSLLKLMPHLGLSASEQSFFENLLVLGTSDSQVSRVSAVDRMKRFDKYQEHNADDSEAFEYLKHWYYVAIREMATLPEFQNDAAWIQSRMRFSVSLKEVKDALKFLFDHRYLRVDDRGKVLDPAKPLNCSGGLYRLALGQFHREVLSLAGESIERVASEERLLQGHTCSLSVAGFAKAKKVMEDALSKVRDIVEQDKETESVYHLELALFPLTAKASATAQKKDV